MILAHLPQIWIPEKEWKEIVNGGWRMEDGVEKDQEVGPFFRPSQYLTELCWLLPDVPEDTLLDHNCFIELKQLYSEATVHFSTVLCYITITPMCHSPHRWKLGACNMTYCAVGPRIEMICDIWYSARIIPKIQTLLCTSDKRSSYFFLIRLRERQLET